MAKAVSLETASRRMFAAALERPGWCRSGKDEERALETLGRPSGGTPLVETGGLPRRAARAIAWHVFDQAWEIEDRPV